MQSITTVGNSQTGELLEGKKYLQVTEMAISEYCGENQRKEKKEEEKDLMRQIAFNYP